MHEIAPRDAMADDATDAAAALVHTFGIEAGHLYAFARAHAYLHFGGDPNAYRRLFWRKVVLRVERIDEQFRDLERRRGRALHLHAINVRT